MSDPLWQYQVPLWVIIVVFLALLLIPMEIGYRLGERRAARLDATKREDRSDVTLTSMLALLGLMLAFTYSFSLGRADLRKMAIVNEVNAIGTAFLRADLLAEPGRSKVREVLYAYAKSRYSEPGSVRTRAELQDLIDGSVEIRSRIWPAVMSALKQNDRPSPPEAALLISSINDVLDANTNRMAVIYDRLPTPVLALLILTAGASLATTAYNSGAKSDFNRWRITAFALILASLMYIILDYDMMLRGLIQVDHSSLVRLIADMEEQLTN